MKGQLGLPAIVFLILAAGLSSLIIFSNGDMSSITGRTSNSLHSSSNSFSINSLLISSSSSNPTPSTPWAMYQKNLNHTGLIGNNSHPKIGFFSAPDDVFTPLVVNDTIYVAANPNKLFAIDASSLTQIASFTAGSKIYNSNPVYYHGKIYVGSDDGFFYELNATDLAEIVSFTSGSYFESSPVIQNNKIYVGDGGSHFFALNATDLTQLNNFTLSGGVFGSPAIADDIVYVVTGGGKVHALNTSDLTQLANFTTGSTSYAMSPAVANGILYAGFDNHKVYALNATDLTQIASFTTGDFVETSQAVVKGIVYIGSGDHKIYALNATDLTQIASFKTGDQLYLSSPTFSNGIVYIGSGDHNLYVLNASNLAHVANLSTSDFIESTPVVSNGVVYIGSDDNTLYAFNATSIGTPCTDLRSVTTISSDTTSCPGGVKLGSEITVNSNDVALECQQQTLITGPPYISSFFHVNSGLNNVSIKGCTMKYCSGSQCIMLDGTTNITIANNTIIGTAGANGIKGSTSSSRFLHNTIYNLTGGTTGGFKLNGSNNLFFENIINVTDAIGIYLVSCGVSTPCINNTIRNNRIVNGRANSIGIAYLAADDGTVTNNTIIGGAIGIEANSARNSIISHNTVLNTSSAGLILSINTSSKSSNNNISDNMIIKGGDYGINLSKAENNSIANNMISNNTIAGILIESGQTGNILSNDRFSNNALDIFTKTPTTNTNTLILLEGRNKLKFENEFINVTDIDNLFINDSIAAVNSSLEPAMNTSANITLRTANCSAGITFYDPFARDADTVLANGQACNETTTPACTAIVCASHLMSFTVSRFSSYAVFPPDVTPPFFVQTPTNRTLTAGQSLNYKINASDDIAVDTFFVNDTVRFKISSTGLLQNNIALSAGLFALRISVNDTSNNINSTIIFVNVTAAPASGGGGGGAATAPAPPVIHFAPCTAKYICGDWGSCSNGTQTRACIDQSRCYRPRNETKTCEVTIPPTGEIPKIVEKVPAAIVKPKIFTKQLLFTIVSLIALAIVISLIAVSSLRPRPELIPGIPEEIKPKVVEERKPKTEKVKRKAIEIKPTSANYADAVRHYQEEYAAYLTMSPQERKQFEPKLAELRKNLLNVTYDENDKEEQK